MPQMAPLNWLILFWFFSLIFILFNVTNYYSFLHEKKITSAKKSKTNFYWKW